MLTFDKKGYIAIVVAIFVPIVLYGVKFMLDNMSAQRATMEKTASEDVKKHCAKDAALQVAKNWNPGLTLGQQKAAVLKVADAVYNASPCYFTNSVIGRAIYGLDVKKGHKATNRHPYMPTNVSFTRTKPTLKTIGYSKATKYMHTRTFYYKDDSAYSLWNRDYASWRVVDKGTDPVNRVSDFDEVTGSGVNYRLNHHDIYANMIGCANNETCVIEKGVYFPNNTNCYKGWADFAAKIPSKDEDTFSYHPNNVFPSCGLEVKVEDSEQKYSYRKNANDDAVQISIKDDKIKVLTDDDVGYAKPASCNVDIVLAVPVNGASCNIYNLDAASVDKTVTITNGGTTEEKQADKNPVNYSQAYEVPDAAWETPIYQIGQACKGFVKQFYHTRGVNMGLIPYSAKVSISPDKTSYVNGAQTFNDSYFRNNPLSCDKICGAALYYTRGERDKNLATAPVWGGMLMGCPIMCRRGTSTTPSEYGNNAVYSGDFFSVAKPAVNSATGYQRMNLNPCYLGYTNLLSLKCDMTCKTYLPNPFYMIEPTADLVKIYELCNALYPYYDLYSVSNFIFIPLEWANNFFQSWTRDPACSASANNASESNQRLSRQSKMTSDRKKAVILIVNKPDWFEPGELTYLGFDNDASEISMVESDKIRFDINYGDTSRRFLDGSYYNTNHNGDKDIYKGINNTGLIAGAKKILKFQCTSGTMSYDSTLRSYTFSGGAKCKLTYPKKGLIKIVVKPSYYNWKVISTKLASIKSDGWRWHNFIYVPDVGKFLAVNDVGRLATSTDAINWTEVNKIYTEWNNGSRIDKPFTDRPNTSTWYMGGIAYGGGKFIVVFDGGQTKDFYRWDTSNSTMYTGPSMETINTQYWRGGICYANGRFYALNGAGPVAYNDASNSWKHLTTMTSGASWDNGIAYGNGMLMALDAYGHIKVSVDGKGWGDRDQVPCFVSSYKSGELAFGGGEFLAVRNDGYLMTSPDGYDWVSVGKLDGTDWLNACYANGSFYVLNYYGSVAKRETGTITFGNTNKNGPYTISKEQAFYFRPEDLKNDTTMTMTLNGVQLVSAEIMNFDLDFVTPKNVAYKDIDELSIYPTAAGSFSWEDGKTINCTNVGLGGSSSNGGLTYEKWQSVHENGTYHWLGATNNTSDKTIDEWAYKDKTYKGTYFEYNGTTNDSTAFGNAVKERWYNLAPALKGFAAWATVHGNGTYDAEIVINGTGHEKYSGNNAWSGEVNPPTFYIKWRDAHCEYWDFHVKGTVKNVPYEAKIPAPRRWGKLYFKFKTFGLYLSGKGTVHCYDIIQSCWGDGEETCSFRTNSETTVRLDNAYVTSAWCDEDYDYESGGKVTFTDKTALMFVVSGSGTFKFTGGVSGTTSYSPGTFTIDRSRLTSNNVTFTFPEGLHVQSVSSSSYVKTSKNEPFLLGGLENGERKVKTVTTSNMYQSGSNYIYELGGMSPKAAARLGSRSATVDDMIDFCDSTSSKNGVLSVGEIQGGKEQGLWQQYRGYTEIKLKKRGKLKLRIATALWSSSGDFSIRSGIDEETRNFHDSEFNNTPDYIRGITSPIDVIVDIRNQTPNSDGTYTVRFGVCDIALLNAEFIQDPIPNFKAFSDKTHVQNTRSIDYSDLSGVSYDTNVFTSNIFLHGHLDKNRGRYATYSGNPDGRTSFVGAAGVWGDAQAIQNDFGVSPSWVYHGSKGYNLATSKMNWCIYNTGCIRIFNPHWRGKAYHHLTLDGRSGENETNAGGKQEPLTHEVTYPLNWILWKHGYQGGFSGVSGTTPTQAVRNVTVDVCGKLKSVWGSNLKVYIIKYRGQDKYKTFPFTGATQTEEIFDYDYLKSATSSGGSETVKCADVFYEAADSNALKTCLNKIADDIKSTSFANYKPAEVVE